ncbi:ribonuclease H family protein [Aspergillus aculeatinus CBS 121060]|uniref:Uncharacterized protein n=1 Tax=Aspergillus aculeatinus CBS 121060 TaxID=1448322 RepID=A0ACD1H7Q6_9EURO|nr:hypothetical protein BO66DRAFT_402100 [Aspergillus aculeatinus CBS 121060]RAH69443.1 hypothetical protein BO66DRAFT_402100 [Aspergillus aculeatinus CBS 121060]
MPPPQILIKRATEDACLRVIASPFYHRALLPIRRAHPNRRRPGGPETDPAISPLNRLKHRLARDLGLNPGIPVPIETVEPILVPPKKALRKYTLLSPTVLPAYTDGSGHSDGIGAAAVIRNKNQIMPVSREDTHTVYSTELTSIKLALVLAEEEPDTPIHRNTVPRVVSTLATPKSKLVVVLTDNQAAIRACAEPRRQSGQAIIKRVVNRLDRMPEAGWQIRLQ